MAEQDLTPSSINFHNLMPKRVVSKGFRGLGFRLWDFVYTVYDLGCKSSVLSPRWRDDHRRDRDHRGPLGFKGFRA